MGGKDSRLSFELSAKHASALQDIAGKRQIRLAGKVVDGKFSVDFIACNAPFIACNSPFTACNSPFTACNAPFTACNAPFGE